MTPIINPHLLLETARTIALHAGELVRDKFAQPRQLSSKGFRDLVTDADLSSQKLITDAIRARFPDHGFLPEESDSTLPVEGPIIWIIDPIDGTTNYSRQLPVFCISIAAAVPQVPVGESDVLAGVVYDPMRNELFSGAAGHGATLNDRPIRVSHVTSLSECVVCLDWSHSSMMRESTLSALHRFAHQVHSIRALGSATLALSWVAAGRLDGYLNLSIKPWDIAAAGLIIREAGGQLTDLQGQPYRWSSGGNVCIASNSHIHQDFLQKLTP